MSQEMDMVIAIEIFGWVEKTQWTGGYHLPATQVTYLCPPHKPFQYYPIPKYSTIWADAQRVEARLEELGLHMAYAEFLVDTLDIKVAYTPPRLIWSMLLRASPEDRCRAALATIRSCREEQEEETDMTHLGMFKALAEGKILQHLHVREQRRVNRETGELETRFGDGDGWTRWVESTDFGDLLLPVWRVIKKKLKR